MSAVKYEWHLLYWTVASACMWMVHLSEIKYYFFGLDDPNQLIVKPLSDHCMWSEC